MLQVGNTTDLYGGIQLGASQIASVASPGYVNRALLFTDGEPTAGTKDFASIVGQVAEQKTAGITITALGFGMEYNEELLAAIAKRSGGNYYYITRPELIPEIFRKELETLMNVVARNVKMRVHMSRWVQVRQIYNKLPTFGHRSAEVTLADLERGQTQTRDSRARTRQSRPAASIESRKSRSSTTTASPAARSRSRAMWWSTSRPTKASSRAASTRRCSVKSRSPRPLATSKRP